LYYTESMNDGGEPIANNIYKYNWSEMKLKDPILIKSLPAESSIHNGGAMIVGKDGTVYAVTGDQYRVEGEGLIDNPLIVPNDRGVIFAVERNDSYYGIGVRNSFGLAIDPVTGNLWDTENGPARYDEINLVPKGFNSGWPVVMGPIEQSFSSLPHPIPNFLWIMKAYFQIFIVDIYNQFILSDRYAYSEPEFSWEIPIAVTAIDFANSLFEKDENSLFVGDCNNGNIYRFKLNSNRDGFVFEDPELSDFVLNAEDNIDEILFGKGFGCITDIQFKDDSMYVVELIEGTIYKIYPKIPT